MSAEIYTLAGLGAVLVCLGLFGTTKHFGSIDDPQFGERRRAQIIHALVITAWGLAVLVVALGWAIVSQSAGQ